MTDLHEPIEPSGERPCSSCGRVNERDARFCVECGAALSVVAGETAGTAAAATAAVRPDAPHPRIDADLPEAEPVTADDDTRVGMAIAGAVAAVVVVVLAVVAWSALGGDGDDDEALRSLDVPPATVATTMPPTTELPELPPPTAAPTVPVTTLTPVTAPPATAPPAAGAPAPTTDAAPDTTAPPTTAPPTTAAPTTPPPTTGPPPTLTPGGVPGDLGIEGRPMRRPPCDGGYITIVGSATGPDVSGEAVEAVLDQYPDSEYLRTDQTCPSLRQSINGNPVYVVFFGPYSVPENACAERSQGPADSYVRSLSETLGPDHTVDCPT